MRARLISEKGIALLIVLSTLMVLTISVVEFAYTSRINYQLAIRAKERLQAYYLAKSGLNFSKLLLKYHKESEKTLESAGSAATSMVTEPLYRMLPVSSNTLRGLLSGEEVPEGEAEEEGRQPPEAEEEEKEEANTEEAKQEGEAVAPDVSMLSKEEAEKFLSFEGDFAGEITEEQIKFDLNRFSTIVSTSPAYDQRKQLLLSILMEPQFKDLFENQEQDAQTLAHALSDWIDSNEFINEFENVQRGSEDNLYSDAGYRAKSGKMMSLSEMRLVSGMTDDIYQALVPYLTVYNPSEKINVCLSQEEDVVKSMIYHYTHNAGCTSPIEYDNEEKIAELTQAVLGGCPEPDAMAAALNTALGLVDLEAASDSKDEGGSEGETSSGSTSSKSGSTTTATPGSTVSGCIFQFKDLLTKDNKVFTIKGIGTVGETELTITTVVNIGGSNPNQWPYYYYRIE